MGDPLERPVFVDASGEEIEVGNDGQLEALIDEGRVTAANPDIEVPVRFLNEAGVFETRRMPYWAAVEERRAATDRGDPNSFRFLTGNGALAREASNEEYDRIREAGTRNLDENYSDIAFIQAAGDTLTFGGVSAVEDYLDPRIAQTRADVAAANPLATAGGVLTGALATALTPGGAWGGVARQMFGGRAVMQAGQTTRQLSTGARLGRFLARETLENTGYAVQVEAAMSSLENREFAVDRVIADAGIGTVLGLGLSGVGRMGRLAMNRGRGVVNEARAAVREAVSSERNLRMAAVETAQRNLDSALQPSSSTIRRGWEGLDSSVRNMSNVVSGSYRDAYRGVAVTGSPDRITARVLRSLGADDAPASAIRAMADPEFRASASASDLHRELYDLRTTASRSGRRDLVAKADELLSDPELFGSSAASVSRARGAIAEADLQLAPIRKALGSDPQAAINKMTPQQIEELGAAVRQMRAVASDLVGAGAGKYARQVVSKADEIERGLLARSKAYDKAAAKLEEAAARARVPEQSLIDAAAGNMIFTRALSDALPLGSLGSMLGGTPGAIGGKLVQSMLSSPQAVLGRLGRMGQAFINFEKRLIENNKRFSQALRAGRDVFKKVEQGRKPASPIVAALRNREQRDDAINDIRAQVATLSTNPQGLEEELTLSALPLTEIDETMGGMLQMRAAIALSYLMENLPVSTMDPLNPNAPAMPLSASEADKFADIYESLEDPMSIYENLLEGTLSLDAVKAVRTVLPEVYAEIGSNIASVLVDHIAEGKEIPYQLVTSINQAFGIETDPTQSASFLYNIQNSGAQTRQQAEGQGLVGPRRGAGMRVAQDSMTQNQRIQYE